MFSVDNFYRYIESHYGWNKTNIVPWTFCPHGSKRLHDLRPLGNFDKFVDDSYVLCKLNPSMILHDQEPFDWWHAANIYRGDKRDEEKNNFWLQPTDEEIFLFSFLSIGSPILCHSEKNSRDIDYVQTMGVIPCYYFWHGLIARDWFRHWKHNDDLARKKRWSQYRFLLYARDCTGTRTYRTKVKEKLSTIQSIIKFDWHSSKTVPSDASATIEVNDAVTTDIHLVAETLFDSEKIHVTEKCFKPMVMRQPFILFAPPGTLSYLRSYGFKTFHDIWDESYDTEKNHDIRLQKVTDLIHSLSSLTMAQWIDLRLRCEQIVEHNHHHFFSDTFETQMLDELRINLRTSIMEQNQKNYRDPGGIYFSVREQLIKKYEDIPNRLILDIQNTVHSLAVSRPFLHQQILVNHPWISSFSK